MQQQAKQSPSRVMGPMGGADLHYSSPQPDISLHCKTTDMRLVHHVVCV